MPVREFTDGDGVRWVVWDTRPTTQARLGTHFAAGWLTFECGRRRRRLAPTPDRWHDLTDEELLALCREAVPARKRKADDEPGSSQHERRRS